MMSMPFERALKGTLSGERISAMTLWRDVRAGGAAQRMVQIHVRGIPLIIGTDV